MIGAFAVLAWLLPVLLPVPLSMSGLRRCDDEALSQLTLGRDDAAALGLLHDVPANASWYPVEEPDTSTRRDGRGTYERTESSRRGAWRPHVQAHMVQVLNGTLLGKPNVCGRRCPNGGRCLEEFGSIRLLKECAVISFGPGVLQVPLENLVDPSWSTLMPNHSAVRNWFDIARGFRLRTECGWEVAYNVIRWAIIECD